MGTAVVYVHGLWLTGLEGGLLRRRLASSLNAETYAFSYPSVRSNVTANALSLARFLGAIRSVDALHVVGHSLGGLVVMRAFESQAASSWPPGRLVVLGSPLQGSLTAQRAARLPLSKAILGLGVHEELFSTGVRTWGGSRELAVIAGNLSVGLGRLLGSHDRPSDGTVFLHETRLEGAVEHLQLRVSHTGLPFSKEVARQTGAFFQSGHFIR
jgi:pimeloyl-ACP methyl ester carboxylesterase